jgi:hypothetical protein
MNKRHPSLMTKAEAVLRSGYCLRTINRALPELKHWNFEHSILLDRQDFER